MCMHKPKIPDPPPPPEPPKEPDTAALRDRQKRAHNAYMAGGTLLTGPGGLTAAPTTGQATLLGG